MYITLFNNNNIKIENYLDYFYIPIKHRCETTIALNHVQLKKFSLGIFNTLKVKYNLVNYIPEEQMIKKQMINI